MGTCLGVKRLHGTGLGTGLVRWGGRAVSPEQDMLCWWALLAVQCPCPPAAAGPRTPGESCLTLLLSPQLSWTNKKGFSAKRSKKALFLALARCRETWRVLEQERLCLFPRFLRLVL